MLSKIYLVSSHVRCKIKYSQLVTIAKPTTLQSNPEFKKKKKRFLNEYENYIILKLNKILKGSYLR